MAEGVLFNVAEGIIGQLGQLALKEIGLLWGVKEELENLKNTVSTINAVLLDAEEKQAQSHAIKDWVAKLKDVLFKADDLLDDFSTEVLRREVMTENKKAKEVRIFFSKSNQLAYGLKMGHKIKSIRERLDAIEADRKFHLEARPRETQGSNRVRESHHFVRAEDVIGREVDKKVIIERLLDSNIKQNVTVHSIVGLGGLGKTTLAQLVFNDEEIKSHFEKKLWVCISDDFDVEIIVKKILEFAKGKKLENFEKNKLINDLQKEIGGYRYFLVLDDVWNDDSEKWDKLKRLLLGGARGSRILLTTREEKVAKTSKAIDSWFLRYLNEEESWSLFKQTAFENGQEPKNLRIKEIGMEIVRKCRGIPLAIKTIGSILYFKNSEEEWLSFKNNEFSKIDQKETDIIPTLKLSYDHLPSNLKQCFAYCSLFPKDYHIERNKLIKLWMAQGFIKLSSQNQCLEDVGHEYFMELLWRSLFQEPIEDMYGNIRVFKIHDLMHDLAKLVAGQESTTLGINRENIVEKTHHVSVGFDLGLSSQIPTLLFKAKRIRTFILPTPRQMVWNQETCDAFLSSLTFLRMLDLSCIGIRSLPHSIGKLKHLRYLDLSQNFAIQMLPNSITSLQNLETLDLSFCYGLMELPRNITKLVNLRHLDISNCRKLTHMPCGLGQLTNLQSLSQYVLSTDSRHGELMELQGLNGLRENLSIKNLRHEKDTALDCGAANLKGKQNLHGLELEWIEGGADDVDVEYDEMSLKHLQPHTNLKELELDGYRGMVYPSWLLSLTNLVDLRLRALKNWQHMPPLHQFPSLKTLILSDLPSLEYISNSVNLPSLVVLNLSDCPNLKEWKMDSIEEDNDDDNNHSLPSFSRLSILNIRECPKLSSMPVFPCLERLGLVNSNLSPLEQTISKGMIHMASQENPTITVADSASSTSSTTSSFVPLSKLKSLTIGLKKADRDRDRFLRSIRHLTAIEELEFRYSDEIDLFNNGNGMEWQGLKRLQINSCPNLTTIPEWICNFTSLQSLRIQNCPNLTSLPEGMPKSLSTLFIWNCPKLLERCKREKGEDWPKIAHIPNLELLSEDDSEQTDKKKEPELKTRRLTKILGSCSCSTSQ
ncbi:putative disease resistance protein RGA4 [Quercus lobata]|uniref:putative disease resistance protein RGA4 n=1 Tax=Quercus lobata TaxID=97700 RepID=UPI001246CB79|nr:putative disease resistance protein RGA4 [Quercus lobata]XP_030965150.1 putative disease resistance protein RGA4 [Quercus lobata]XP_030965151.1 putative disease resistance protein RGA4 [Quercus lobata]XP_030965152.1 putative disease resistance protein RGA4 [Quercus lobata]XP_030965153.1 putative disease resistance protein RGA4 [Quercus lobata]XP_030965154.1 putative disease resistance protein RGA4 [Quercus lobata]XP_030965155.1 putative disease resistance protein RGA4 [Quercus lobata]XP_0